MLQSQFPKKCDDYYKRPAGGDCWEGTSPLCTLRLAKQKQNTVLGKQGIFCKKYAPAMAVIHDIYACYNYYTWATAVFNRLNSVFIMHKHGF